MTVNKFEVPKVKELYFHLSSHHVQADNFSSLLTFYMIYFSIRMNFKMYSTSISFIFGVAVLIIITAISSGCGLFQKMLTSMNMHPELVKRSEDFPGSAVCGDCHVDIYIEWIKSSHSKSYISEDFKLSTNNYEFKFCLGCHVPDTIFAPLKQGSDDKTKINVSGLINDEIVPRAHNLEDGVDCQGCHLTLDCTLAGPHDGISPHPIEKKEELYLKSELCGKCHVDTFEEYSKYIEEGNDETCQDCHMPAVRRKLIQNEPWQKLHVRKDGKAHTFSVQSALKNIKDFVKLSFTDIKYRDNQITGNVEIFNAKVNHSIPTGKYGYKEILLLVDLKNSIGGTIKTRQESMFLELNTQLEPKKKRVYGFTFNIDDGKNGVKKLEASLFRTNFNRTSNTLLSKEVIELDQSKMD